jgi:zinc transport system substrate-binding protein
MTVLLAAALLLGGCAALADDETPDDRVVAAAFYPLEYAAERIADGHVPIESLTSPGVEPHDLDLGVGETATLARASVVVYEEGFQPAVDAAVETNATGTLVDAAEVVDLDTDALLARPAVDGGPG